MEKKIENANYKLPYVEPNFIIVDIQVEKSILQASGELPEFDPLFW